MLWTKARFFPQWLQRYKYVNLLVLYLYKLVAAVKPDLTKAHVGLGSVFTRLGKVEQAIQSWRTAIAINPDLPEVQVGLIETLIGLTRFDEAFACWEQAFSFRPDWPDVHTRVQHSFYLYGQTRAARRIMQGVLDARNDFARAHHLDRLGIRFPNEFPTAVGHIAVLDSYVKMGILGQRSPARPILLVRDRIANRHYLNYWRRYLPDMISDPVAIELLSPLAKYLEDRIFVVMSPSGEQIVGWDYVGGAQQASIQAQWEAEGRDPLLTLTDSDHERGWECLRSLGVPSEAWFVGLHVREGRTKSRGARDDDIDTYGMAIESIVKRGGWVIRMGGPSMTPLPPMPQVIDYAHSGARSDWMDVFLWARCRFFIGTVSGPAWVPPTFGVPCVATNWTFLSRRWFGQDLFIPKLLWSEREQRYLSFDEALTSSAGVAESLDYLASIGIRIVDNSPEEINDVVMEMLDRLDGKLKYSEEDKQLEERFDKMWASNAYKATGRVGRDFLRKWAHLL